ncbi:MAG: hypothetical protein KC492_34680, partial [Myxococcales bacterium]|nr:hypothetical protein [Myxococcales bacterium]
YYDALNSCRGFGESAQPTCCRVYYGPKRVGESCTPSDTLDDCGPGLRCAGGTCVALCGDAGKPQLGESCEFGSCAAGLWCDDSSGSAECAPLPGAGESCNDSFECAAGLNCVRLQSADVCVIPGALGEACEPYTCGDGMGCVEGVCATKKPAGSICEVDEECFGVCEGLCLDPRPEACFLFP